MLSDIITNQPPNDNSVLMDVVRLHLLVDRKSSLNGCLAMGEEKKLLTEGPQLRIGHPEDISQEEVQPLLHWWEGEEVLTTALQGQERVELLQNDIPYDKTERENKRKTLINPWAIIASQLVNYDTLCSL